MEQKNISADDLIMFATIAEQASLVRAAERLGMPKATVSRRLSNLEELLDRSDQALYASKRTGRNKVSKWIPEYSTTLPGTGPLPIIKPQQYL